MIKQPESLDRITKTRLRVSTFGSVFSIALTMFLIGSFIFIGFFSSQYISDLSKKMEVEILFYPDVKEADVVLYEQQLKLEPFIASSRVSSRADNTQEAIRTIGNNFTEIITNPINASIIFSVSNSYADADSLNMITKRIKENIAVQDVQYPQFVVNAFFHNYVYQLVIFGICLVFMLISMVLIANSIRLNIYAKRFNIKSMLLVGATRAYVRRPFVFKGFIQGVWGGAITVTMLAFVLYECNKFFQGNSLLSGFIDFSHILEISLLLCAIFVFSTLFTMIVSAISVN
ncbi:MAG: permease-like cell division protein FtsX, partial [Bacteroidales bacterium]|nr:permease-like cell division protein FtsX [Bacteroidales bacterium]